MRSTTLSQENLMMRRAALLLGVVMAVGACRDATGQGHRGAAVADSVFLEPSLVIGLVDGDPNYLFGSISSVTADGAGRIYVADQSGPNIRVFDRSGSFVRQLAGPGQGPGELAGPPRDIAVGDDGRLYVRDGTRITVWAPREDGALPDSVAETWSTPNLGNPDRRGRVGRDGRYYYPDGMWRPGEHPRFFHVVFEQGVRSADTLEVPPYDGLVAYRPALVRIGVDALRLTGLSHVPFSPLPMWDVTPSGTLVSSDGISPELVETTLAGDTLHVIALPELSPRPIPQEERADSLAALERRIQQVSLPLDRAEGLGAGVLERRLPDILPSVLRVHVSPAGSIWAERWPPASQPASRVYDIVEEGRSTYTVVLRAPLSRDPAPWLGRNVIIAVTRDPVLGVERVVRFDLP